MKRAVWRHSNLKDLNFRKIVCPEIGGGPVVEPDIRIGLLTGGCDRPYAFDIAMELASKGINLDVIGGDDMDRPELYVNPRLTFLNLRGDQRPGAGIWKKVTRVLIYYLRLIRYVSFAKPRILHILWNNKFQLFDRTALMLYYKAMGKRIALTAHNVNAGTRDGNDGLSNRLSLKIQYQLADRIFVHTEKMKAELLQEFGVRESAVTVVPFGINNSIPETALTPAEARRRLGIKGGEKVALFFGHIEPYKGLDYLVGAFERLLTTGTSYRLIIAGQPGKGSGAYLAAIRYAIGLETARKSVISKFEYISDEETEMYFKAADVAVLPYVHVYQSGVLFLAYRFGVPVIATDVGSFREDILDGKTGFVCKPCDAADLASSIEKYFNSDLFNSLDKHRQYIKDYAKAKHSWDIVGEMTRRAYLELLCGLS
jgi:D-inositol-3-phosphate glycosyltransferase